MSVPDEVAPLAVRSITLELDPRLNPGGSHAEYAARLLERAVANVEVDVAGLVQRYLQDVTKGLPADIADQITLRTIALVQSVLTAARSNMRHRLALDLATTLLPRLERTPVQ